VVIQWCSCGESYVRNVYVRFQCAGRICCFSKILSLSVGRCRKCLALVSLGGEGCQNSSSLSVGDKIGLKHFKD
jgi:hypothetical protein